jgi:hypothetical protein
MQILVFKEVLLIERVEVLTLTLQYSCSVSLVWQIKEIINLFHDRKLNQKNLNFK